MTISEFVSYDTEHSDSTRRDRAQPTAVFKSLDDENLRWQRWYSVSIHPTVVALLPPGQ